MEIDSGDLEIPSTKTRSFGMLFGKIHVLLSVYVDILTDKWSDPEITFTFSYFDGSKLHNNNRERFKQLLLKIY